MLEALCDHQLEKPGLYLESIIWSTLLSLVVINRLGLEEQAGHRSVSSPYKCQFHRDERYQILPAYAQDGVMLSRIFSRLNGCHCVRGLH
jgi:hypothetical protein